jgi:hypothetical protein
VIAKLYRGDVLIGSIDIGHRHPHTLRVVMSLGGQVVRLGSELEHAAVPPTRLEHIFARQLICDFDTKKTETRYVMTEGAEEYPEPDEAGPKRRRKPA